VAVALFLLFTGRLRLRAPLLIWFGSLSCSLYLLLPAMQRLGQLLTQTLGLNGPLAASASAVFGLALAITSALLCRRLLEHPLTRAGNRLTGQRGVLPLGRLHSR
ncbi:MAG TPA: acyltransferase, partial [Pseudomonas sp.]|nr:acyltransferase [Pseudomonas sp.]